MTVDGVERSDNAIPLLDDRQGHSVGVRISALDREDIGSDLKEFLKYSVC